MRRRGGRSRQERPGVDPHLREGDTRGRGLTPRKSHPAGAPGRRLKRLIQKAGRPTVNVLARFSLRTGVPVYPLSRQSVVAVETLGRKTGKRRLTPMGYVVMEDRILVVSEHGTRADWYRNAREAGSVRVLYKGRWCLATIEAVDDDPGAVLALMPSRPIAVFNRALWHRPRVVELRFAGEDGPDR